MDRHDSDPAYPESQHIVVFSIRRESRCSECGRELSDGNFLRVEKGRGLCMECADLDHLLYLPAGDAALTRRARKHSTLSAVVVRWARARNRYERRGLLVEEEAMAKAEQECLADAEARARRQARAAEARAVQDEQFVESFAGAIRRQFPSCPQGTDQEIARYACEKYSDRIGRSAAAKELDPQAVRLAVIAHIRHRHTDYDKLLATYLDRHEARSAVQRQVEEVLAQWAAGAA